MKFGGCQQFFFLLLLFSIIFWHRHHHIIIIQIDKYTHIIIYKQNRRCDISVLKHPFEIQFMTKFKSSINNIKLFGKFHISQTCV